MEQAITKDVAEAKKQYGDYVKIGKKPFMGLGMEGSVLLVEHMYTKEQYAMKKVALTIENTMHKNEQQLEM